MNEVPGILEFNAQVVILRSKNPSPQEGVRCLVDALVEVASRKRAGDGADVYLFISLAGFTNVSSTFLGMIGNLAVDEAYGHIKKVALCGTSAAVNRRLQQFHLLSPNVRGATEREDGKVRVFTTVEEGVTRTIPCG